MRKFLVLCAAVMVGMAPAALGSFITDITTNAPTLALAVSESEYVIIADGSAQDSNSAAGAVTFIGSIGNWDINVTTGITDPALPAAYMDLNSVDVATANAGVLEIWWSDPVVQQPFPPPISFLMSIGGTMGSGSVVYQAFYGAAGTAFDDSNEIGSLEFRANPFDGSVTGPAPGIANPFSLTQLIVLDMNSAGATSFNSALEPTPEPGVAFLIGSGLLAFGAIARRRRQR